MTFLLTLVQLDLTGNAMSEITSHDIKLFHASMLQRLFSLGLVVRKEQFGPMPPSGIINSAGYHRLFTEIHGTRLLDHEDFARMLVEKGILSEAFFATLKFNPLNSQESNKVGKKRRKPNTEYKEPMTQILKTKKKSKRLEEFDHEASDEEKLEEVSKIVDESDPEESGEEKSEEVSMDDENSDRHELDVENSEEAIIIKSKKRKQREKDDEDKESSRPRKKSKANEETNEKKSNAAIQKDNVKCIDVACQKVYTNWANMKQHYLSAHKERNYACTHQGCEKEFRRNNDLKRHVETKHLMKSFEFKCKECDVICSTQSNLRRHATKH